MDLSLIYCSYLLRLWQVREETGLAWRATLQDVKTGEQHGFADLDAMLAFLRSKTEEKQSEERDSS